MLGLGNALTRSINFGLLGEASIFNNSPAIGSRQYGGIVLGVEPYSGPEEGNAVVYVGAPSAIQYSDNSNPKKYFDTAASYNDASNYINDFSTIQDGEYRDDWIAATRDDFDKIIDFLSTPSSQSLFRSVYNSGLYTAFVSANVYVIYDTRDMFDGVYYNSVTEYVDNNPIMLFPIRKEYTTLKYNTNIDVSEFSLRGTPPEAIGNLDESLNYTSSVQNINPDTLSAKAPSLSAFNVTAASTKNGVATFTLTGPAMGTNPSQYAQEKSKLPPPWNKLSGDVYAVFYLKLDYYNEGVANFFDNYYNLDVVGLDIYSKDDLFYDTSQFVGDYGLIKPSTAKIAADNYLCYAKVKEVVYEDVVNSPDTSVKFVDDTGGTYPTSTVVEIINAGTLDAAISGANVCYKFEFDMTVFKYRQLLNSLAIDLNYNKFALDQTVELFNSGNLDVSIYDHHINTTDGANIPQSNWWMKCKVGILRFVSDSYLPSDVIVTPEKLQNIYVPLFPASGPYPAKGERFKGDFNFSISDYMDKAIIAENDTLSKSAAPLFLEYRYDTLSELNASTVHSSGDYAFVGGTIEFPSFFNTTGDNGLYSYDGSVWTKTTLSNGNYVNYSGNLYVYIASTGNYSRFTDSDIFVSN